MLVTFIFLSILAVQVIYLLYLITKVSKAKSFKQELEDNEKIMKKRIDDLREFKDWLNQEL